jgi:hypothetical protein
LEEESGIHRGLLRNDAVTLKKMEEIIGGITTKEEGGGGVKFKTLAAICFACSEFRGNVTGLDVTSVIKFERN